MTFVELLAVRPGPRGWTVFAFFTCALFLGVLVHRDYGISADEPQMYTFGVQVYAYLLMNGPEPSMLDWNFHNPLTHVFMVAVQRFFSLTSAQAVWFSRHLISYLFFLVGLGAFYRIALRVLNDNWKLALVGCAFFLLTPRIFAHAFYNPKDIPTLVLFTISMATLLRLRAEGYSLKWLAVHAFVCAASISLRSSGVLVVAFTVAALLVDVAVSGGLRSKEGALFVLSRTLAFAALTGVLLVAVWPRLWADPIGNFLAAVSDNTSRIGGGFYFGRMLESGTPWHYVPVWIFISTPLLYTALCAWGIGSVLADAMRHWMSFVRERFDRALVLGWFVTPIVTLVALDIGVFDEWRHVFFLYPAMLLLALIGLENLWESSAMLVRRIVTGAVAVSVLWVGTWMIGNHPFQFAYFSVPAAWVDGNFELDYWSVSYYRGLAWVLEHDDRAVVPVYTSARVGYVSGDLFPPEQWSRLRFVSARSASYVLDNFRWNAYRKVLPESHALHHITVSGVPILTIYRGGGEAVPAYPTHAN